MGKRKGRLLLAKGLSVGTCGTRLCGGGKAKGVTTERGRVEGWRSQHSVRVKAVFAQHESTCTRAVPNSRTLFSSPSGVQLFYQSSCVDSHHCETCWDVRVADVEGEREREGGGERARTLLAIPKEERKRKGERERRGGKEYKKREQRVAAHHSQTHHTTRYTPHNKSLAHAHIWMYR